MAERPLTAYKFLRSGAVGPFSGILWPKPSGDVPGTWVERPDGLSACEPRHLPMWIREELWQVDLDGHVQSIRHKVIAPRARLLRRIDAWSPDLAGRFASYCARRAAEHAAAPPPELAAALEEMAADADEEARDAVASDDPLSTAKSSAVVAYIAAMAARRVAGPDAYDTERARQADWLVRELDLA